VKIIVRTLLGAGLVLAAGLNLYIALNDGQGREGNGPLPTEESTVTQGLLESGSVDGNHQAGGWVEPRIQAPGPATNDESAHTLPVQDHPSQTRYRLLAEKAKAHLDAGDQLRFIGVLKELRDLYPEDAAANRELGRAYVHQGEDRNAVYYLEKALSLEPEHPATLQALSLAYYRTEDLERANQVTRQYLEQTPDDTNMRAFLEKIEREREAQTGFIAERTDHFELYYDSSEFRHLGRPILDLLDDAYRQVGSELGFYPDGPISVILYSNRSFREVTLGPDWTGGIYDGKIRLPVRDMELENPRLAQVIRHEYVHAVVHRVAARCPTWLNEGLAGYFEGRPLPPVRFEANLREFEGSFMALDSGQAQAAYLVSLSAVTFMVREFGMYRVRDILLQVDRARTFQEAFDREMPLGYDEFIRRWNEA